MENMGYCRFENTVQDLEDCQDVFDDTDISKSELKARKRIIQICVEIASDYGDELND